MEREIIIYEDGEVTHKLSFSGGYNLTITNTTDDGKLRHIRRLDNGKYDEKCWIKNYRYRPIAYKLVDKFKEIEHVDPSKILFIEDLEWKKPSDGKRHWIARIAKSNKQLYAMTGYEYVLTTRNYYTDNMSAEKLIAVIYHELMHIDIDGSIREHDIEDWSNMVATLGADWMTTISSIPNILELDKWDEMPGTAMQIGMFGDRALRAVK